MNNKTILLGLVIAGILVAGAVVYTNYQKCQAGACLGETSTESQIIPSQEAADKLINFINDNILKGQAVASLIEVLEENGFYKVKFNVEDQEVVWQMSRDGKLVFPQVIDLTKEILEPGQSAEGSSLENFAKCLTEKGMKFYGASWCSWCEKEKELFGEAAQYLPYVECVTDGSNELTAECQQAGVESFPSWKFPNGEMSSGFKSLEELSEISGCTLE